MKTKEELEQLEKLRQYMVPGITAIIILIISLAVVRPIVATVIENMGKNKGLQKRLLLLETKLVDLKVIDEFQINKRVKSVEKTFPSERPIINLLFTLSRLSQETGVIFGEITMKPGKVAEKPKEAPKGKAKTLTKTNLSSALQDFEITFTVSGDFANISQFISKLEKTAPIMRLENITLSFSQQTQTSDEKEGKNEVAPSSQTSQAQITVRVFYQSLPETLGSINKSLPKFTPSQEEIINEISEFQTFDLQPTPRINTGKSNPFEF